MLDDKNLPRHIAIIMDGNGRWAKRHHLPKLAGHREGTKSVKEIVTHCRQIGIGVLTVYAFSTENWKRPKREVDTLMDLLSEYIDRELENLKKNEIRLNFIGDLTSLPLSVRKKAEWAMHQTKECSKMVFNVAVNYGGRSEIVMAIKKILQENRKDIDEQRFSDFLYTKGLPDPDLLIRTSGEMRISNFLLWQSAYTEFYFTKTMWPEFKKSDLDRAIESYQERQRHFGA